MFGFSDVPHCGWVCRVNDGVRSARPTVNLKDACDVQWFSRNKSKWITWHGVCLCVCLFSESSSSENYTLAPPPRRPRRTETDCFRCNYPISIYECFWHWCECQMLASLNKGSVSIRWITCDSFEHRLNNVILTFFHTLFSLCFVLAVAKRQFTFWNVVGGFRIGLETRCAVRWYKPSNQVENSKCEIIFDFCSLRIAVSRAGGESFKLRCGNDKLMEFTAISVIRWEPVSACGIVGVGVGDPKCI